MRQHHSAAPHRYELHLHARDILASPLGPGEEERRPRRAVPAPSFARALQHGNPVVAEATARKLGRISLAEALELTILIAQKEPKRLPKVAVRWLQRYLEEEQEARLDDVALVVSALFRPSRRASGRGRARAASACRVVLGVLAELALSAWSPRLTLAPE